MNLHWLNIIIDNSRNMCPITPDIIQYKIFVERDARVSFDADDFPVSLFIQDYRLYDPAVSENRLFEFFKAC